MKRRCLTNIAGFLLFVLSTPLLAADVTGRWTGTFTVMGRDGEGEPGPALLLLKQEGTALTGTAGPNEGDQSSIQQGKVEGGVITFTIERHEGQVMKFTLKHVGDEISGDVRGERNGEMMRAKLSAKREK